MRRLQLLPIAIIAAASLVLAPVAAQTDETSVTIAGAGVFPQGAAYLGLPLSSLSLGVGLGVAGVSGVPWPPTCRPLESIVAG